MKQLCTLILLLCALTATAKTPDSIRYDTVIVPTRVFVGKQTSSFSAHSLKKSKIARKALRQDQSRFIVGDKYVGLNFSFGIEELDDELLITSIELPEFRRNVAAASLVFGYFTSPTSAWGGRLMYNYGYNDVLIRTDFFGILNILEDAKTNFLEFSYTTVMHRMEAYGFHRLYVPLGDRGKNFYFFNEISFHYGFQHSITRTATENQSGNVLRQKRTESTVHRIGLGLAPGLTYFSGNRLALEFQLGTSGVDLSFRNAQSLETGRDSHSVGFQFRDFLSILRIKIGMTFYFN